ncbi:MAG: phytoene synthase [Patescibacteria group bacterium]|nr:MAG: phytoene synthase [Patescibacteria group bacterium]
MNIYSYQTFTSKHTKTFYYSTLLFPKKYRAKVFLLYSFLRIIDDLVDKETPDKKNFYLLRKELENSLILKNTSKIKLINDIVKLIKENDLSKEMMDYLKIQEKEIAKKIYKTNKEFTEFLYGVAGTVGIMMSKILNLPPKTFVNAKRLGEALQIINTVRDIKEDYRIGRIYIPEELLNKYGLTQKNFLKQEKQEKFFILVKDLLNKAFKLIKEAKKSFVYFKKEILFPIKTASDLYLLVGKSIYIKPELIFNKKKLKPNFIKISQLIISNFFFIYVFNKKG